MAARIQWNWAPISEAIAAPKDGIHENAMGTGHIYKGIGYEKRSNDSHISHGAYSDLRHMDEEDRGYEDEETQPLVI